jgi:ATP-dependent DNA helicase RecQ
MSGKMAQARHVLKSVFGFDDFISIQAQVIENVLEGIDTLAVMPTGGGKSLCFQIPSLIFDGVTVVVSPLISLMNDQVQQLQQNGVAAVMLNSTLDNAAYRHSVGLIKSRRAKLLYVAPESLLKPRLIALLEEIGVDCLAVDEVHCISEWGHDFRPEYRRLAEVRQRIGKPVCLALTATATRSVREDIRASLGFQKSAEYIASFNRPNLRLGVKFKEHAYDQALKVIRRHAGEPGIIYCATRRQVDHLHKSLTEDGIEALPYHAGMPDDQRNVNQARFAKDDAQVMVATVAFGMGIDKSNVRFVIHFDLPKNIESYYQEIGRAGRDGAEADCILLYSYGDIQKIKYLIGGMDETRQRVANLLLTAMLRYVESDTCRRRVLLNYFGEPYEDENCQMCDNCLDAGTPKQDLTIPAPKMLSCVKRGGERFGVAHIIDILRGSKSQSITRLGHHQLSTYAIGLEYTKKQWQRMARQLLHQGFMAQDMEHGGLQLTDKAWDLFKEKCRFHGLMQSDTKTPPKSEGKSAREEERTAYDNVLFEILRAARKELADTRQLPPYVIFSDRTLMELSTWFPITREALLEIHGIGELKAQNYGDVFLGIIQRYCAENDIARPNRPTKQDAKRRNERNKNSGLKKRSREIGNAYNAGESISELETQIGIPVSTVAQHLFWYWRHGNPVRGDDSLLAGIDLAEESTIAAINAFDTFGCDFLRPVYMALNGTISYDELQLARLLYISGKDVNDLTTFNVGVKGWEYRKIVCLANSRKYGGRCIAGKEWRQTGPGDWVRPVGRSNTRELLDADITAHHQDPLRLLDIIVIPIAEACPQAYQSENHSIALQPWKIAGRLPTDNLNALVDDVDLLWVNGFHSYGGSHDRIPLADALKLDSSLVFIEPEGFEIVVQQGANLLKQVRGRFKFKEYIYCLSITDPMIENQYLVEEIGQYQLEAERICLTISISEPFEGYCYKLIAAVISV